MAEYSLHGNLLNLLGDFRYSILNSPFDHPLDSVVLCNTITLSSRKLTLPFQQCFGFEPLPIADCGLVAKG